MNTQKDTAPVITQPGFQPKQAVCIGGKVLASTPITYNDNRYTAKITVHIQAIVLFK